MKHLFVTLFIKVFKPTPKTVHFNCLFCKEDMESVNGSGAYCRSCNLTFITEVQYTDTLPPVAQTELRGDYFYGPPHMDR